MPTAFDVRALSSTVRIELDDSLSSDDQESIKARWVDLAGDGAAEPDHVIHAGVSDGPLPTDGSWVVRANSPLELAQRITSEVTIGAIGGLRGEALMLHASAVALADGRVIGFVGPSGRGKTTVAQALGRSYGYVTDETLAVRPDGSVIAYPKPLSIGSRPSVKNTEPASSLGLRPMPAADLQLAAIVLLDRRLGIERPFVESVPVVDALSELVPQTSHLPALAHPLRALLDTILATGGVRRVVYSEASSLPSIVDDVLAESADQAPMLTDVGRLSQRDCDCFSRRAGDAVAPKIEGPGAYWRAAYADALVVDDALIVLLPGRVVGLAGLGPALWLAADGLSRAELQQAVLRELPEPDADVNVDAVVSEALDRLVEEGILVHA